MFKSILTIFCFIGLCYSQIQYEGTPKFYENRLDDINFIQIDQAQIIDRNFHPMVFQYGEEYLLDINILESVEPVYDEGVYTYLLGVKSEGAYGIGFIFDNFYQPTH